ncbi:MAG: JAB domain-containing protein [Planctomycetota bacterium]
MNRVLEIEEPVDTVHCAERVFDRIRRIHVDYRQENFLLLTLDVRQQLLGAHVLFKGGRSVMCVDPAVVFRRALLDSAEGIVVAHNHPSGCLDPSDEDLAFSRQLARAGELLSIPVLDSVVFNEVSYHSIGDGGGR